MPVIILSTITALAAQLVSYSNGLQFAIGDAVRRIDIARKIYDSETPGILNQMGTVWLPISTVLNIPFAYIESMWVTGVGVSFFNMIVFVLNCVIIFKLLKELTSDKHAIWLGTLLFMLNPNVLYFQTTAMSENLFLYFITLSVFWFVKWHKTEDTEYLVFAGFASALAAGTRYEGWIFTAFGSFFVLIYCFLYKKKYVFNLFAYSISFGVFAIFWFGYNYFFYGDILSFQRGQYSSEFIARDIEEKGGLFAKENIELAILTTVDAVKINVTSFIFILSIIGLILYLSFENLRKNTLFPLLLIATFPLTIMSLYTGQIFITVPDSPVPGYLNTRYGLYLLPAVVIFSGYLFYFINKKFQTLTWMKWTFLILVVTFYIQDSYSAWPTRAPGFYEAYQLKESGKQYFRVSEFFREFYDGGGVIVGNNEINIIPFSTIPMRKRFYVNNNEEVAELFDTRDNINWVIMLDSSMVGYTPGASREILKDYGDRVEFVLEDKGIGIYRVKR